MPPPKKISAAMQAQQQQQQCCQQMERENHNAEMHAEASEQPTNTANELIVVDLSSENTNFVNDTPATNNNMNVVYDIRSLAAADSHVTHNIDDAVILQYEHNNYNNNNIVENELMHFDDIHIRHNNNHPRNRTNRLESRRIQPCNISEFSDNAHSCIFDTMAGNIVHNPVAEVNRAEGVETPQVDRVCSGNATGGGDGIDGVLLAPQHGAMATPNSELSNSTNNVLSQLAFAEAMELVTQNYLQRQTQHSRRSRSRRRRRHRGYGGRGGHQRHNQIRRSLKSMNKTLRKTVYTLRRIKSLLLQQVQMAREFQQNVLTA